MAKSNMDQDILKVLITEDEIRNRTQELGDQLYDRFHDKNPMFVGVLSGCFIFMADLVRAAQLKSEVEFIGLSSYKNATKSSGCVQITRDLQRDISGRDIIVVEDILDSGNTLAFLKDYMLAKGAKSITIVTLLDKPARREKAITADLSGFVVPDEFVVGYGLDYCQQYRNMPYIGVLKPEVYRSEGRSIAVEEHENRPVGGKRLAPESRGGFWNNWGYLIVTVAVIVVLFKVIFQLSWVPSGSMETTIPEDTLLISWQLPYMVSDPTPQRGDIVTFWSDELGKLLVKRVVGLPGDEITFQDGYTYINGEMLDESYLPRQGITQCSASFLVPEGCVFFMGDNRTGSNDARFWKQPYISVDNIRAKVMVGISVLPDNSWRGVRVIH